MEVVGSVFTPIRGTSMVKISEAALRNVPSPPAAKIRHATTSPAGSPRSARSSLKNSAKGLGCSTGLPLNSCAWFCSRAATSRRSSGSLRARLVLRRELLPVEGVDEGRVEAEHPRRVPEREADG